MGLTGVITDATLQLQPVETSRIVCDTERTTMSTTAWQRMLDGDHEYRYSVAWIDCLARGGHLGRAVLTRGNHATLDDLPALPNGERARLRAAHAARRAAVAAERPHQHLSSVRAFNEMWFRKAPRTPHRHVEGIKPFFFPLDGVRDWNRVYGSRGFVQYQFVVPFGAERVVRTALERFSAAADPDVPRRPQALRARQPFADRVPDVGLDARARHPHVAALAPLLDGLDELVVEAGGRVYLTKDARLRPELLARDVPAARRVARGPGRARSDEPAAQRHGPPPRSQWRRKENRMTGREEAQLQEARR